MKISKIFALLLGAAALPLPAASQELIIGAGYTDFPDEGTDNAILSLEYLHTPFATRNRFSARFAAALNATPDSDVFFGAGIAARWAWQSGWFADASLMPGVYREGSTGNDLGHDLEFRTLIGIGYRFDGGNRLSLAITHKSNASISDINPGVDALLLRFHVPLD